MTGRNELWEHQRKSGSERGTASAEALKSEGTWCVQRRKPSIVCKRKSIRR